MAGVGIVFLSALTWYYLNVPETLLPKTARSENVCRIISWFLDD